MKAAILIVAMLGFSTATCVSTGRIQEKDRCIEEVHLLLEIGASQAALEHLESCYYAAPDSESTR